MNPSAWVAPFGFLKDERESEAKVMQGSDEYSLVVTYVAVIILDLVTLPLAILWAVGVGRETDSPGDDQ
jgi:hypothetical protein